MAVLLFRNVSGDISMKIPIGNQQHIVVDNTDALADGILFVLFGIPLLILLVKGSIWFWQFAIKIHF